MAAATEQKRKPGWMSIPGGPKEPNVQEFRTKFSALVDEKKKAFEELKGIRAEFDAARGESGDKNDAEKAERDALRSKISKIDAERKKERETRRQTDERIKGVRDERRAIENELQKLSDEVGAFDSVEEIDAAIDLVMYKLETGAGSIKAEKETIKRLNKLEEAKGLLLKLEPLAEAIADAEERELDLRQESRDVHARIAELNAEFEKNLKAKMEKDSTRKEKTFDFAALHKKREAVSAKIDDLNKKIDELKANFDKAQAAWNEWRIEAQQKYADKIAAERAEREREWKAKEEARKLERRRARAAKKVNPHKVEIEICGTLIAYLEQKVKFHQREEEEARKRKELATFDPTAFGTVLGAQNNDEWLFGDRTKKTKPAAKKAEKPAAPAANEVAKDQQKKQVHHSADKTAAFAQVQIEAPATYGAIAATVKLLQEKKKTFESKIVLNPDDVDVTTSEDEAEAEVADDSTVVASTAAPAA